MDLQHSEARKTPLCAGFEPGRVLALQGKLAKLQQLNICKLLLPYSQPRKDNAQPHTCRAGAAPLLLSIYKYILSSWCVFAACLHLVGWCVVQRCSLHVVTRSISLLSCNT